MVLVSIENIYQTLKTVFEHISKHLEGHQKYSAGRLILNSLGNVMKTVFRVGHITISVENTCFMLGETNDFVIAVLVMKKSWGRVGGFNIPHGFVRI